MKTLSFTNGDTLPMLGLGTWKSDPGGVGPAVRAAIEIGYRHVDCAAIYGNESEIGAAFSSSISEGLCLREDLWVTSKLWNSFHEPKEVRPALERSLKDLQLEYLDLYLMHWPVALKPGSAMPPAAGDIIPLEELPLADTWAAMEALVDAGLVRHIGVSNFSIPKLRALQQSARKPIAMNQIELHPYLQQKDMLNFCQSEGIVLTAYSPLGSLDRPAMLKDENEPILLEDEIIVRVAKRHEVTPAQVLLSWALHRNTVVIPKSVNPERLQENFDAQQLQLSAQDLEDISKLDRNRRYVSGSIFTPAGGPLTLETLWDE